jgi:hypothetical protein
MSKVVSCNCPTKPDVFTDTSDVFLDTLAQLRNPEQIDSFTPLQKGFQKRSRAKMLTDSMNFQLIDLESKLLKSYWQTYWCTRAVLQEGDKLKSRYCNQRWCLVCNRIRTAKLINGYIPSIDKLEDAQFVTLTRQTVDAVDLADTIQEMQANFVKVKDRLRKQGIKLVGIRKIEIKYNELSGKYHPHYHLIVDGLQNAQSLVCEWVSCYSEDVCNIKAQDVRKADKKAPIELFKYFTKMLTDSGRFYPEQMDVIFQVMKGKRTFQPFGGIKKQSEDIELDEQTNIDWLPPQTEIWVFEDANEFSDWYNAQGEPLSQVKMSEQTMQLRNNILEDNDDNRQTESKTNSPRYVPT